ncbi:MAG: hypothetical protein QOJ50_700, partial [Cryptosporangiaceae bacterium]|nr:hypothetical protein [Cryptosporangiaceae bacterium]
MTTLTETRPAVAATPAEGSNGRRDWLLWIARNCVLIALAIAFLGPILFIFLTAVMPAKQTLT